MKKLIGAVLMMTSLSTIAGECLSDKIENDTNQQFSVMRNIASTLSDSINAEESEDGVLRLDSKTLSSFSATYGGCNQEGKYAQGFFGELKLQFKTGESRTIKIQLYDEEAYCSNSISRAKAKEQFAGLVSSLYTIVDGDVVPRTVGDKISCEKPKVTIVFPASPEGLATYGVNYVSAKCP